MSTVTRDRYRRLANRIRAIPGKRFGLRPYTVQVVVKAHTGSYGLEGSEASATYTITESGQPPKVRFLNNEELTLSGLGKGSIAVGPITPDYTGGGNALSDILGSDANATDIVHYVVTGPEFPNGAIFERKSVLTDRALHYMLTLSPVSDA